MPFVPINMFIKCNEMSHKLKNMSMKEKTAIESAKIIWILWEDLIKVIKFAVELSMGIINFNENYLD